MTKLKIILISLFVIVIILGNFWYYTQDFQKSRIPSNTSTSGKNISSIPQTAPQIKIQKNDTPPKTSVTNEISKPVEVVSSTDIPDAVNTVPPPTISTDLPSSEKVQEKSIAKTPVITPDTSDDESPKTNDKANYTNLEKILIDTSWNNSRNNNNYSNYWGNENISFSADTLKVFYPKGSNAPSNSPRGGAGFVYAFPKSYNSLSMSYTVRFDEGFDFVKGGKLPGLCGGNCSRGGNMSTSSGFSMRFVWKKNGYLDIMTFFPNTVKVGNYSGEKMIKFEPGKEYLITQQITLNDIGKENGVIHILVDGKSVYKKDNLTIRISPDVQISSFLFSTFFGGKDETYSSSKDTYIYFGKFKISETF